MKKIEIITCLIIIVTLFSITTVSSFDLNFDFNDNSNSVISKIASSQETNLNHTQNPNLFGIIIIKTLYHGKPISGVDVKMYEQKSGKFVGNMHSIDGTAIIKGKIGGKYNIVAEYPTGEVVKGTCKWHQDKVILDVK